MAMVKDREVCIIGRRGFIGSALAGRLGNVTSHPVKETRVVFHFGSHVHPAFEENPSYFMTQQLHDFAQLLEYCTERGIRFVYPSSALVYEKETPFSRFKKALELLAGCYGAKTLGLRIFPAYGPGENRTVISQWCRQMRRGESPTVYGDGSQSRDFIYIDDVVDQILYSVEEFQHTSRVVDIGTGIRTSFNDIVAAINRVIGTPEPIAPHYVNPPFNYSDGIVCASPLPAKVTIESGIRKIIECFQREALPQSSRPAATSALAR